MARYISCNLVKKITFIGMLELNSNHRAFYQSKQYNIVARSKVCGTVPIECGVLGSAPTLLSKNKGGGRGRGRVIQLE